jgi:hypothetical protein
MAEPSTGILGIIKFACAILGIGLFMWTPRTGKGFLFLEQASRSSFCSLFSFHEKTQVNKKIEAREEVLPSSGIGTANTASAVLPARRIIARY